MTQEDLEQQIVEFCKHEVHIRSVIVIYDYFENFEFADNTKVGWYEANGTVTEPTPQMLVVAGRAMLRLLGKIYQSIKEQADRLLLKHNEYQKGIYGDSSTQNEEKVCRGCSCKETPQALA